jgi:hypothetical protein
MKRAFLFGLGSFLSMVAIGWLLQTWRLNSSADAGKIAVALICGPLGVVVIRAANRAPYNSRFLVRLAAWLGGFFALDAVILGLYYGVMFWR